MCRVLAQACPAAPQLAKDPAGARIEAARAKADKDRDKGVRRKGSRRQSDNLKRSPLELPDIVVLNDSPTMGRGW